MVEPFTDLEAAYRNRERIARLREKEAKEAAKKKTKSSRFEMFSPNRDFGEKENNMAEAIKEQKEKTDVKSEKSLLPIPTKPDTSGMKKQSKIWVTRKYYEENKEQIIAEFLQLSPEDQKKTRNPVISRWGISPNTWTLMRARWLPHIFKMPEWYSKLRKTSQKDASTSTEVISESKPETKPGVGSDIVTLLHNLGDIELPVLPSFENTWPQAIQVEWLKTYRLLVVLNILKGYE